LPKDSKFNVHYYASAILQSFADYCVGEIQAIDRKLMVHADNARPHTIKVSLVFIEQNEMKRAARPFYSSHLVPSLFLFSIRLRRFSLIALSSQPMTICQRFGSSWRL
jgi:hypothetical protein